MKKQLYFENLDGLRFLCFLSVFFVHCFNTEIPELKESALLHFVKKDLFGNGILGVNFFFVLSGFLITFLLIEEKKLNGQVHLRKFWIRRILRIWPLFYFCVFFGFVIFPRLKEAFGQVPLSNGNIWAYLTFTNNFDYLKALPDSSVLSVLWSVAIEEQFYLVWPIVLYVFPLKRLWIPFGVIIVASLVFRAFHDTRIMLEHHTLSCIGDMTVGAIGAWLINVSDLFKRRIENLSRPTIATIYILFILIYFFRDEVLFANYGIRVVERMIIAVVIIFIILEQCFSTQSFFKLKNFKVISNLGVITYGLYCLHFIGILIAVTVTKKLSFNTHLWQVLFFDPFLGLVLTIIIGKLSYRYFESPFLRLKERFSFITK